MKTWKWIVGVVVLAACGFALSWLSFFSAVFGGPTLGSLFSRDDGTIKWSWFYNLNVELEHLGKPFNLHVVISCGSVGRQILGEGRSARAYWAPYIFGVEDQGHGVLVQSPGICGRDFKQYPIPDDYMPVMFWAPDAKNLELMIAYLHEDAYAQPVSKLKFIRATIADATEGQYETWRQTTWRRNIVPLASKVDDHKYNATFFRSVSDYASRPGAEAARRSMFAEGDPRKVAEQYTCHSILRRRLPEHLRSWVGRHWPNTRPNYWLLDRSVLSEKLSADRGRENDAIAALANSTGGEAGGFMSQSCCMFSGGGGIARVKSKSNLGINRGGNGQLGHHQDHRIPYYSTSGFPWASDAISSSKRLTLRIDTANGADQGFGYCYRDVWKKHLKGDPVLSHSQEIVIDGKSIGISASASTPTVPFHAIVERDEFLWSVSNTILEVENARNQ
jgi:hypothetical protein